MAPCINGPMHRCEVCLGKQGPMHRCEVCLGKQGPMHQCEVCLGKQGPMHRCEVCLGKQGPMHQYIIKKNILVKYHHYWTKTMASSVFTRNVNARVFTNQMWIDRWTTDKDRSENLT
ncbi:hypothetical protein DPMN_100344 [Dreissena polymorpha]|uniref:Uncharacterized protein n=1 Tax=Dreissena polymorpha TaxID=45954 RepID=A0A9D4R7B7_DREPO|nr:hypothetical protein DPMN_100344 [Dreissena polymorpha]